VGEFKERFDFSTLRWIMTGAAPVPVALTELYHDLGIGLLQVYGLTESCGPACVMDSANALKYPDSTGKAFFFTDVKVVDEEGNTCPPGEAGEVWVAGRHIMIEYWNRPEATSEAIVDGWLRTGDVATMNEEGFVAIQDRIAEVIDYCRGKLAGYKQPKAAVFIEEIPRNPSGKILKRLLREQFPAQAPV
jgi:long-subunit acyl-CoA synthetase (AMP-forming)